MTRERMVERMRDDVGFSSTWVGRKAQELSGRDDKPVE
jgi:hypothetical protein